MDRRFAARLTPAWGCVLTLVVSFSALPAEAADWSAIAASKVSYTDDVFQFSAVRRLRLSEDPSQPTVVPVDKKPDVVWDPSMQVIRSTSSSWGPSEVSFKAHGFIYTNNSIFNHGNYRLQWKQALSPETSVLLRYRYVPNLFLGPNFERRTGTRQVEEERVTSHIWRTEVERKLSTEWTATLVGRGGLRLYNAAFAERDTRFWSVGPQVSYAATSWTTVALSYLYERGLAAGAGDLRFNDDVSYRQHIVSLSDDLKLAARLSLHLLYLYRRKDFTSDLVMDTHFGRQDNTHQGSAEFRFQMTSAVMLSLGFQRTQRSSTNEARSFNDTIVSIGGQYAF
jgi:hypothetical protein